MKRLLVLAFAAVLGGGALFASKPAQAAVSVSVQIGDRYRGASLSFYREPRMVLVPSTRIFHARDRDLFRFGSRWYFVEDGFWYGARSWRGPFVRIRVSSLPVELRRLNGRYRGYGRYYVDSRDHNRGRGRHQGWDDARDRGYDRNGRYDRDDRHDHDGRDWDGRRDRDFDRG